MNTHVHQHHDDVGQIKASTHSTLRSLHSANSHLVKNSLFKNSITFLIILNGITMGIATFDFVTDDPYKCNIFDTIDIIFLSIFTVELLMHSMHYGWGLFTRAWLVFDFTIILTSWFLQGVSVLRVFRIFRLLRIITHMPELHILVKTLLRTIPSMSAIGALLLLVYYIFAVMFTTLFKHMFNNGFTSEDYFSRLDTTMFTLFQIMTLDSWSAITKEVMNIYPWAWLPVIFYIVITSFVVINLVIGVLVDASGKAREEEQYIKMQEIEEVYSETKSKIIEGKYYGLTEEVNSVKTRLLRIDQKVDQHFLMLSDAIMKVAQTQEKMRKALEQKDILS